MDAVAIGLNSSDALSDSWVQINQWYFWRVCCEEEGIMTTSQSKTKMQRSIQEYIRMPVGAGALG